MVDHHAYALLPRDAFPGAGSRFQVPVRAALPQDPAVDHNHQPSGRHRRGGRGGQGAADRAADFGLLLDPFARALHLLVNHRFVHHHAPTIGHRRRLGVRRRGNRREAKFRRQPRRGFLRRHQYPRPRLRAKPCFGDRLLAVVNGQLDQPQFGG